jgi:polyhydroxyalkanoate synthesis regulator phasin
MSNPLVQAFFVGRAAAEVLSEKLEFAFTDALSELGKMDAELREQMRQFTEEVMDRANRAAEATGATSTTGYPGATSGSVDLQATIDDLRAEIATLRTEIQRYRNQTNANG